MATTCTKRGLGKVRQFTGAEREGQSAYVHLPEHDAWGPCYIVTPAEKKHNRVTLGLQADGPHPTAVPSLARLHWSVLCLK